MLVLVLVCGWWVVVMSGGPLKLKLRLSLILNLGAYVGVVVWRVVGLHRHSIPAYQPHRHKP